MNLRGIGQYLSHHTPSILTAFAISGVISTTYFAVRATPEAVRIIEAELETIENGTNQHGLTRIDIVKLTWRPYLPAALMGGATIAAIIGANSIHLRREGALAGAYALSERAYREYREKAIEHIGSKKDEEIRADVAKDALERMEGNGVVFVEPDATLCYDRFSGRIFYSDRETIRKAENDVNAGINNFQYASLNDFWRRIELDETDSGEVLGWNSENPLSIEFSSTLIGNRPALAIDFHHAPIPKFHKVW